MEGVKFWLQVVTELKNRGVTDIFIACVDGLKGFPEAMKGVSANRGAVVYLAFGVVLALVTVGWKQRKEVALLT